MSIERSTQDLEHEKFREVSSGIPSVGVTNDSEGAGEDLPNDVQVTQERNDYFYIATATTTTIITGPGILKSIVIGETAAGAITIYDNTAGSGTIIGVLKASIAENTYTFNAEFSLGCTIVTAGASKITVSAKSLS